MRVLSPFQSRLLALFVSVAVFLSISTNLRVSGFPIGVGEVSLALLMVGCAFLTPWKQMGNGLFLFWMAVWVCTALGFIFGNVTGALREHNAIAYIYTGLLTLAFITIFDRLSCTDLRKILFCFVVISVAVLWIGFLIYINFDQVTLANLRIDTSDHGRYQGWCQNANQMSLLLVPTPFLVMYLWDSSTGRGLAKSLGWGSLLFLSVTMGLIVRSDALGFSWLLGLLVLFFLALRKRRMIHWKGALAITLIFVVGFLAVRIIAGHGLLGGYGPQGSLYANESAVEKLRVGHGETDQKVGIRLQLWKNALSVWEKSPIFGQGPGAYSSFKLDETQTFSGTEAHNTLIDLLVQGGALLGLAYLAFFIWVMRYLWRSKQDWLFVAILMLFSFEFFMFHLRQPVLWLYLTVVLALVKSRTTRCETLS